MQIKNKNPKKTEHRIITATLLSIFLISILSTPILQAKAQPQTGGTIIWAYGTEPVHLNPASRYIEAALRMACNVFGKLVQLNHANGDTIIPDLAESWEISDDATVYTFHLRENVRWHDGEPFTSADVKWTFEEIVEKKGFQYAMYELIDTIETPDNHTVICTLKEPNGGWLYMIGSWYGPAILPAHLYDIDVDWDENEWNRKPIGTGPFKFEEWVEGSHMKFVRNDDYYLEGPYLDAIIVKFVMDSTVALAELEAGTADYMEFGFFEEVERIQQNPDLYFGLPKLTPLWIGFNLNETRNGVPNPFHDVRVRKAVAHAINRSDISMRVYKGVSPPANGTFLSFYPWCYNEDAKQPEYDVAKANELLDEAGYPRGTDGIRFQAEFILSGSGPSEVIKEHLKDVGIDLVIQTVEWGTLVEAANVNHDFDMCFFGGMHGPDPEEWRKFIGTGGFRNAPNYSNPRVDELLDLGLRTVGKENRAVYYYEIQEILAEDLPCLNLVEHSYPFLVNSEFKDFFWEPKFQDTVGMMNWRTVYWEGAQTEPEPEPTGFPMEYIAVAAAVVVVVVVVVVYLRKKG